MQRFVLLAATALAAIGSSSPILAQEIVGLTHKSPLLIRQDTQTCKMLTCQVLNHQSQVSTYTGGTAYDGRAGAVWISNGTLLDVSLPPNGLSRGCAPVCKQQKVPFPPSTTTNIACTGMACLEAGTLTSSGKPGPASRLFFTYTTPQIGWADASKCGLSSFKYCNLTFLGSGTSAMPVGGLAIDDLNRRVLIGVLHPSAGAMVYVVSADNPCTAICRAAITVDRLKCSTVTPLKLIAGMAYDACSQMLFLTDGVQVIWGTFTAPSTSTSCRWIHLGCCGGPTELYTGLAMLPHAQGTLGKSCTAGTCSSCAAMLAKTTGTAVMGNGDFSLDLVNAPSNATAYALAIGLGHCGTPGVPLGFCANALVSFTSPGPFVYFLPPAGPPPPPTCNGGVRVPAAIPVSRSLCNLPMSFQWVVGCGGSSGGGHAVSNCVSFTVSGI